MSNWDDDQPLYQSPRASIVGMHENKIGKQQQVHDWASKNQNASNDLKSDAISFEIDQNRIGLLIGKGGSTIKEIKQRFSVDVEIGRHFDTFCFSNRILLG